MQIEQKGSISITLSYLKQHRKSITNMNDIISSDSDIVSVPSLVKSVNNVMASFKRARQRMLLACQPILSSTHN